MIDVLHREDPTPVEIAERCREIQAGWTDEERIRRMSADRRPSNWLPEPTSEPE